MPVHDLHISQDGTVEGVHCDALDLHEIGHVTNERASAVEWSESFQLWKATIHPKFRKKFGPHAHVSKSRQECIDWEIDYLNKRKEVTNNESETR